jgi:ring-1,2-phenylacetyl-CoA epoxidase subunit PaaE
MMGIDASAGAVRSAGARHSYVACAAGADLAALVGLIATRLGADAECTVLVFFGNYGDVSDVAREELLALKDRYLARLALHFIMEREPEEGELLSGRLDAPKLQALAKEFFAPLAVHEYVLLGAAGVVAPLQQQLVALGVAPQKIHADADANAEVAPAVHVPPAPSAPLAVAGETQVDVIMDGRRRVFTMHTGTENILDAAARAGLDLPFSCRAGVCSTCRTKLVRGEVELAQNYALEDWELAQGFILACQAHAKTPQLEITYDET